MGRAERERFWARWRMSHQAGERCCDNKKARPTCIRGSQESGRPAADSLRGRVLVGQEPAVGGADSAQVIHSSMYVV